MDNCKQIEKLLSAYADGELNERQKALVEQHVANCPHCAALLDEYLALNAAIADCAFKAPEGFAERVLQAVEKEQQAPVIKQGRGVRFGKVAPWIGIGAAALLCVSIASSSLVKFVTQHLIDVGDAVETTAGDLFEDSPNAPSQNESPSPNAPSEFDTQEEAATYDEPTYDSPTYDSPTYDEPTYESPTYEETFAESMEQVTSTPVVEGTVPPAEDSDGAQDAVPDDTPEVTKPELEMPTEATAPETDRITQPQTQPETEKQPAPETEAPEVQTQAPAEQDSVTDIYVESAPESATSGFFARIWQAIEAFFDKLWQAVSRLFGGDT